MLFTLKRDTSICGSDTSKWGSDTLNDNYPNLWLKQQSLSMSDDIPTTQLIHGKSPDENQKCRACGEVKLTGVSIREFQLDYLEQNNLIWYADHPWNGGVRGLFMLGHFSWACDDCLESSRALEGNIAKQEFCGQPPFLAYIDQETKCQNCQTDFVVTKEEQKHWSEELKFLVQALPNNCKTCRKDIKESRDTNTRLSELIKNLDKNDPQQLHEISEIYRRTDKVERSKHYATLAMKALKRKT